MHRDPTPHTWMHRNRDPSSKCTGILPLTHEWSQIIIPPEGNAPKLTPQVWLHWNHHPSAKSTGILPLTHECTEIVTPQVNAVESYPSHMNAPKSSSLKSMHRNLTSHTWMHRNRHSSGKCTETYPSHMNAPKSSSLKSMHRNLTPHTWMHQNHHF